jgi:hypothetical protein
VRRLGHDVFGHLKNQWPDIFIDYLPCCRVWLHESDWYIKLQPLENNMKHNIWFKIALLTLTCALVGGCGGMGGNQLHRTTDLSAYLYPAQTSSVDTSSIPVLSLPLRVGIAFVPAENDTNTISNYSSGGVNHMNPADLTLSESQKLDLMQQICGQFGQYSALKSAVSIPSDYLTT